MKKHIAKVVIIDDEYLVRETFKSMFKTILDFEIVGEAQNVQAGLKLIAELEPDLILLDIKMPVQSGFDLLDHLPPELQSNGIIFVSGYPDEALTALQKAAPHLHSDFVVKPIDPEILKEKLSVFFNKWIIIKEQQAELVAGLENNIVPFKTEIQNPIIFQNSQFFHSIDISDIVYCESANRQINIYCSQYDHLNIPNTTLDNLEKMLPADQFIRTGKSHILNRSAIRSIQKGNRPICILAKNGRTYEVQLYATNVEKVEQSYSGNTSQNF